MIATVSWATIASLATAGGTLVLAMATFSAVRSSNRAARIAESALQEQRRPVLAPSRLEDPAQKIMFLEGNWVSALGGRAAAEHIDGRVYLAISLRNVGAGIAVCQAWVARPGGGALGLDHVPLGEFRLQARDLYIPAGDVGMWQGALRDPDDPVRGQIVEAIEKSEPITVELLYSDQVGLQRTISRFGLVPARDTWLVNLNRHWFLDWDGPRPDSHASKATETIRRETEAAERRSAALEADRSTGYAAGADGDGHSPEAQDDRDGSQPIDQ
jgi:hypothetical protein